MRWADGAQTVGFLLGRGRLETIAGTDLETDGAALMDRAAKRRLTAGAAFDLEDREGAFANAHDVYRMAAECLLLRQGLRAVGGDGSHVVEDAVATQFAGVIEGFSKALFERFRQGRHASQYFDPSRPEKTRKDAEWALDLASRAHDGVRRLLDAGQVGAYG